ncbi:MAG: alpha-galactosidase [Candidatus Brocadiia bacterium]
MGRLTEKLNELIGFPENIIESGSGFKIGDETCHFARVAGDENSQTYADRDSALQVYRETKILDHAVVIASRLENTGSGRLSNINILDPLHLVFSQPSGQWRHIHAHGGTTESYYPPLAYQTRESTDVRGTFRIESHPRGRSSNLHLPFLISLFNTDAQSEGLFCGLEWSGTWHMTFAQVDETHSSLSAGIKVSNLELESGEMLELPKVHLGFFQGGPEAATNALRRYLYEHACASYQGKPLQPHVSYDHWFGIRNELNFDKLKHQADRAAELGIEIFVVDASWFPGDFPNGVGNWNEIDREKFPDGLQPLAEYVRTLGMDFGMWFEIERAHEGTWALEEYPELFISPPESYPSRKNAHLNLARQDAQDWAIETVGNWIEKLDLRWSRWDYNIEPQPYWDAVDPTGKIQCRYMEGLYRVLDTLMSKYPTWMVEGCSSGGRRIDIGTMKRAHTYWFSDQSRIPSVCRYMQARANRFLPGHLLNSSVAVASGNGDSGFNDTSVLSRMLGKLAFDGDIASWSAKLTDRMAKWAGVFKDIRHLFVQDFYQLLPIPTTAEDWDAVQFVAYPGNESAVFAFSRCNGGCLRLPLRGLDQNSAYRVSRAPDGAVETYSGADLLESGLEIELPEESAGLWKIDVVQ